MYLIAGLGNPGQQYAGTRHNIGFMMLDHFAEKNNLTFTDSKWKALVSKAVIWDESVVLLKPQTFMNLSGMAVAQAVNFYKLQPANIIVIHDDLDMEFGRLKIVSGGGDGGPGGVECGPSPGRDSLFALLAWANGASRGGGPAKCGGFSFRKDYPSLC